MNITNDFRLWFLMLYGLGFLVVIFLIFRMRRQRTRVEKQKGPLPSPAILIQLGIPLLILLSRLGEISANWLPLRLVGVALSIYFLMMVPWFLLTMGRFALPGAGILQDHELVTSGPYRYVRHPLYSSAIILWLSAGLGTLNWLLLALWPLFVVVVINLPVRHEEALLEEKFGKQYRDYAQHTGRLIPKSGNQS